MGLGFENYSQAKLRQWAMDLRDPTTWLTQQSHCRRNNLLSYHAQIRCLLTANITWMPSIMPSIMPYIVLFLNGCFNIHCSTRKACCPLLDNVGLPSITLWETDNTVRRDKCYTCSKQCPQLLQLPLCHWLFTASNQAPQHIYTVTIFRKQCGLMVNISIVNKCWNLLARLKILVKAPRCCQDFSIIAHYVTTFLLCMVLKAKNREV